MKNDQNELCVSLYSYLGRPPKELAQQVALAAKEQNIPIRYKYLPKDKHTDKYNQVLIYPVSFLDKYFTEVTGEDSSPLIHKSEFDKLLARVEALEAQIRSLNLTNSPVEKDELPF